MEELKALKPPLSAQHYTLYHKIHAKEVMRTVPIVVPFSPRPARKALKKGSNRKVPFNSPELIPIAQQNAVPFPEIVLTWQAE